MTCLREGTVPLPDGRRLGYAEYGVRGGTPVFHFHGWPGGRFYEMHPKALAQAGAWHFTLERPGCGLSDPQPGRRLLDWPADVAAFADSMGIDRFAVIGTSLGALYALACGHARPERVAAVGLQGGWFIPVDDPTLDQLLPTDLREEIQRFRTDPQGPLAEEQERMNDLAVKWAADPRGLYTELFLSRPDAVFYDRFRDLWLRVLAATYGNTPSTDELRVSHAPWGFTMKDVAVPIHAWHGDRDELPVEVLQRLIDRAPNASLKIYPGEGHFLDPSHHAEMLEFLTSSTDRGAGRMPVVSSLRSRR